jgi:serine/threonine protein kinase
VGGGNAAGPSAIKGYELRELVATDDSTETYRAYQRSVGRQVTINVLGSDIADDPFFIANYLNDTQRVAALEHPNISFVFDTWREPGRVYTVSRWFGGGSLTAKLDEGALARPKAVGLLDQVGDALAYAHREGVVHGAIDPSNVMLDEGGHAYLGGFVVGGIRSKSRYEPGVSVRGCPSSCCGVRCRRARQCLPSVILPDLARCAIPRSASRSLPKHRVHPRLRYR